MQVGKQFDALLIDTAAPAQFPVFDVFEGDSIEVRTSQSTVITLCNIIYLCKTVLVSL